MWQNQWLAILSTFVSIPVAGYAIIRYRKIAPIYLPFVWYNIMAGLNEATSFYTVFVLRNNAVNSNMFMFVEFFLLMLTMKKLGAFNRNSTLFIFLIIAVSAGWIFEYIVQKKLATFDGYFHAYEAFVISLTAVHLLNIQLTTLRGRFFENPVFIMCIAFILYFSISVLTEIFYVYIARQGINKLPNEIYVIMQWVNIIYCGMLIFSLSKMHKRKEFSLAI